MAKYKITWPGRMPRRRGDFRYMPGIPREVDEIPELIAQDIETDPDSWLVREIGSTPKKKSKSKDEPAPDEQPES